MRVDSSPWVRRNALTGAQLNATRLRTPPFPARGSHYSIGFYQFARSQFAYYKTPTQTDGMTNGQVENIMYPATPVWIDGGIKTYLCRINI